MGDMHVFVNCDSCDGSLLNTMDFFPKRQKQYENYQNRQKLFRGKPLFLRYQILVSIYK